jgi:hypothetical protein
MNLRNEAKGRECMVRLPCCNGDPATTVLAHYRLLPYCGTGIKPDDFVFGAWCCSSCHDATDRRNRDLDNDFVRLAHAEGVMRTQLALIKEGVIRGFP